MHWKKAFFQDDFMKIKPSISVKHRFQFLRKHLSFNYLKMEIFNVEYVFIDILSWGSSKLALV